jgi:TnpA family transposase
MSSHEPVPEADSLFLTPRQRRQPVEFANDPTDDELANHWTLTEADQDLVFRSRGEASRRWCALQLCVLRKHGRFLDDLDSVPPRILSYLNRQLGLEPSLFVSALHKDTETDQTRRIREYLGYGLYDAESEGKLERWLATEAARGVPDVELFRRAESTLMTWRIVLPAPSTLERLVGRVVARSQVDVYATVTRILSPEHRQAIDTLLQVAEGQHRSTLFQLKQYPNQPTTADMVAHLARCHELLALKVDELNWDDVRPEHIRQLAELGRRYDVWTLRRFKEKKYALVACLLLETQKTLLDQAVGMHDQYVLDMQRKSRNSLESEHRRARRNLKKGVDTLVAMAELLLEHGSAEAVFYHIGEDQIREAVQYCTHFRRLESDGYTEKLGNRYSHFRQYLPAFFRLPFAARPGAESLLEAIELIRALDADQTRELPSNAPIGFVPMGWRHVVLRKAAAPDRRMWELALAIAVREALRSGDLYLPQSRRHVNYSDMMYDHMRWQNDRHAAYLELNLPTMPQGVVQHLQQEFDAMAWRTERGLPQNPFARIHNGSLRLRRPDSLEVPPEVDVLRRVVTSQLPTYRIEKLLEEVDVLCGFMRAFQPLEGYNGRPQPLYGPLMAAIVAQGTNLGLMAMGHSADGITTDMLQHVMHWYLREDTLKAANKILVDFHHQQPLTAAWGLGNRSSSDAQRFGIQASSLLASFYPRYFGYYDRAISLYTHVSDEFSVFSTQVISCGPREALYVLDGLLNNDTVLHPTEHYTDTHGFTEHVFALCYLLGFSFMPRLRDLKDQQLYKVRKDQNYGRLDVLFKPVPDVDLIAEQWDELVRLAASLKNRVATPSVFLRRLISSPSDRLSRAVIALGRIVKTIYLLGYLHDPEMRQRVQRQLNRGEHRHDLSRHLFFANLGEFRTGDYLEIMNKASCLSLLSNAVLVWNSVHFARTVEQLRQAGKPVNNAHLSHISPLAYAHLITNGTYSFNRTKMLEEQVSI